jgi:hypothetical protein
MTLFTRSVWICHMPDASSDAPSTDGRRVARRKSAVPIAPAIVSPPTTSPNAAADRPATRRPAG